MDWEVIVYFFNFYVGVLDLYGWDLFDVVFVQDVEVDYFGMLYWYDFVLFKCDFVLYYEVLVSYQYGMMNYQVVVDGDVVNSLIYGSFWLFE